MKIKSVCVVTLFLLLVGLVACGQKGPLYLPKAGVAASEPTASSR